MIIAIASEVVRTDGEHFRRDRPSSVGTLAFKIIALVQMVESPGSVVDFLISMHQGRTDNPHIAKRAMWGARPTESRQSKSCSYMNRVVAGLNASDRMLRSWLHLGLKEVTSEGVGSGKG